MSTLCSFFFAFTACCVLASFFYLFLSPHQYSPNPSHCAPVSPVLSHFVLVWLFAGSKGLGTFLGFLAPVLQAGPSNVDVSLLAVWCFKIQLN